MAIRPEGIFASADAVQYETLMRSWCERETSYWMSRGLDYRSVRTELERLHESVDGLSYFEIRSGRVSVRRTPPRFAGGNLDRQALYLAFLSDTVRLFCPDLSIDLVLFRKDHGLNAEVPTFSFQKKTNQTCMLLPDVDFLRDRFFYGVDYCTDTLDFEQKSASAIFVGSTSGHAVTEHAIRTLAHPRIRSAMFFRNSDLVQFHLPSIVQYDNESTKQLLVDMGFGTTPPIPWSEQFKHRFIISMDGNGATCSRLPITFRSSSVLLKYDSSSVLYYSQSLIPWLHYIPISSDEQVNHIVQAERAQPGRFAYITKEAQRFAKTYLTRYRAMQYTSWLLRSYAAAVNPQGAGDVACRFDGKIPLSDEARFGRIIAHVSDRGDVLSPTGSWIGDAGSGRIIQGFAIEPGVTMGLDEVQYQVLFNDGTASEWCEGGKFCGSRGRSRPISGVRVRLTGQVGEEFAPQYSCRFVDGTSLGPVSGGDFCKSTSGAALEGICIEFKLRNLLKESSSKAAQPAVRTIERRDAGDNQDSELALRPLPPFQLLKDVSRLYDRDGEKLVELPLGALKTFIRCFLKCIPFDEGRYIRYYPNFRTLSSPYNHWLEFGYFEGRLVYGWEQLAFDFKELLEAPASYFRLVQKAAEAGEGRYYRTAIEIYQQAIDACPSGIAAKVGLADLLLRLRRPMDSETILWRALERAPTSPRANAVLIEALVDLGQQDLACEISLRSGQYSNTARQVLRLMTRGNLALARRPANLASDDWPLLEKLRSRIRTDWQETRIRLSKLHVAARNPGGMSGKEWVALAYCLARLGFSRRSRTIINALVQDETEQQALWSSTQIFLLLIDAVAINDGMKAANEFIRAAPAAVLAQPNVLATHFRLAYQSGDRSVIEALSKIYTKETVPAALLETWCRSLMYLCRFDQAIEACAYHWPSITQHRWLASVVLQIGRVQDWYQGVSLDENPGEIDYSRQIPRCIMQFWDRETPPDDVRALIAVWPERNPGFEHVLFSNTTAIAFLREKYGDEYVKIFEYCHHPVMKADFFRLAYLVAVGGVYVDADEYCHASIESLISAYPARDLFASLAQGDFFVNNRFLCSAPGHPFLQAVLRAVVADMRVAMQTGTKPDIWHTTGPTQYSQVFAELLMSRDQAARAVVARIGLVYAHELGRYLSPRALNYKATSEGNWRAQ